jgi:murein DD-endopeptidase MepM/ murein hydrolase activator NlpD
VAVLAVLLFLILWATPAFAQDPTPEPNTYVVQRGDTLYDIAQRFDTTVEAIMAANEIADGSLIITGQKLVIPSSKLQAPSDNVEPEAAANVRVHPVRPGENLLSLAFRYGTTFLVLRDANRLNHLGLLRPGQKLTIPPPLVPMAHTPTFPEIRTSPDPMLPGRTMVVEVMGEGDLELAGHFVEERLIFVEEEGRQFALVGVDAMTSPGDYELMLTVVEPDSGDLLTLRETLVITPVKFSKYNIPVPSDRQSLLDPSISRKERQKLDAVFSQVSGKRLWNGLFSLPLPGDPRTTAPFGQRRSYAGGPVTSYHSGHDYGADSGEPVLAPITGTVTLAEPLQVRGKVVILDHGLGVFTGFWHLSQIKVEVGQVVGRGEEVGLVGNTGLSTGPHLHWEMRVHNVPVNPIQWTRQEFP